MWVYPIPQKNPWMMMVRLQASLIVLFDCYREAHNISPRPPSTSSEGMTGPSWHPPQSHLRNEGTTGALGIRRSSITTHRCLSMSTGSMSPPTLRARASWSIKNLGAEAPGQRRSSPRPGKKAFCLVKKGRRALIQSPEGSKSIDGWGIS